MKAQTILFVFVFSIFLHHSHCQSNFMNPGNYDLCFQLQGDELHIPLTIFSYSHWQIRNHDERIDLKVVHDTTVDHGFIAELPFFRTRLRGSWQREYFASGHWEDITRDSSYWVAFTISPVTTIDEKPCVKSETKRYKTVFQNASDTTEAIGQFTFCDDLITGTFMTETGDYRHLHGVLKGTEMQFGTFDGAHLYFFKAQIHSDSITAGIFLSGNKWRQPWSALRDESYSLRDPNRIVVPTGEVVSTISVTDISGKAVKLSPEFFQHHITVVEIMGTWCPNCLDASRFLDTLKSEIQDTTLRVMPILFERGESFAQWSQAAKKFFASRDLVPEYYFGGKASKKTAANLFPSLTDIVAFPTLIIVDREGKIAWVHTGFYGPGTGAYYQKNTSVLKNAILQMLR